MRLNCTRCSGIELDEIEVGDVLIDRCPRCGGLWFDHSEIAEVVGRQTAIPNPESVIPPPESAAKELICPRCPNVQLRRLLEKDPAGGRHVSYRCASCMGTWLDRGELRRVEDGHLVDRLREYYSLD